MLIEELQKLPGIGPRTAERLTYFLLRGPRDNLDVLSEALYNLKRRTVTCSVCFNIAEEDPCAICSGSQRDQSKICVVEEPLDVMALEKTGKFDGVYHVLGGAINPVAGIGPEELRIGELIKRLESGALSFEGGEEGGELRIEGEQKSQSILNPPISSRPSILNHQTSIVEVEVILATNPTMEGEATAMYIKRKIQDTDRIQGKGIKMTRIARGLPTGGDLEYADETTLRRALEGRVEY